MPELAQWDVANDCDEVHSLLCECDAYNAARYAPAPQRNMETTRRRVAEGAVQLLRAPDRRPLAMFTLTWAPPFDEAPAGFPPARMPAYMSRLAIRPDVIAEGTVLGAHCYRRAMELAKEAGADVLRIEANPDLDRVFALVRMLGFVQHAPTLGGAHRRAFLQAVLD